MALCTLKTLYPKHTCFNQDDGQNHCMHRVIQWLRAQYAPKERKKSRDFQVICVKSKSSLKLWMPSQSQVESFISTQICDSSQSPTSALYSSYLLDSLLLILLLNSSNNDVLAWSVGTATNPEHQYVRSLETQSVSFWWVGNEAQ